MMEMDTFLRKPKPMVLLVDDNEDILDYLSGDLKDKYHIHTARDGEEALTILEHKFIELVVSDVMMPGMDGFEFCQKVKSTPGLNHIPIVLLTAKNSLQCRLEGLQLGADAYIEKPFSLNLLYVQIDNLLANRRKLKECYTRSLLANTNSVAHCKDDETFWEQLTEVILDNLHQTDLDVQTIADLLHISKSTLYRRINTISGMSPNDIINITRLKKAADLISEGNFRMNELAETVGYNSPAQFRRNFQKQFKMSPAAYIKKVKSAIGLDVAAS